MSSTDITPASAHAIERAARLLAEGQLVAFPTETVYGLGADATSDRAVASIFEAKGRPRFNPLIAHVAELSAAERLVVVDSRTRAVADRFWPGPLTLVLPRLPDSPVSLLASAGLDSLAIRLPSNPVAQALLRAVALPIVAPSANRSGQVSPTTARHVAEQLSPAMILDGGPCPVGVESTVLDLTGERPVLLRPGGLEKERLEAVLGPIAIHHPLAEGDTPRSPGMLTSHYAPRLPVRLNATEARPGELLLGFGPTAGATLNLSAASDLAEAAAHLFAMLRALDRLGGPDCPGIAVASIPTRGLGLAINDRLARAAAPRPERPTSQRESTP